jgi:hypothetical protein
MTPTRATRAAAVMATRVVSRAALAAGLVFVALAGCGGTTPIASDAGDAGGQDHAGASGGGGGGGAGGSGGTTGAAGSNAGTGGGADAAMSDAGADATDGAAPTDGPADGDAARFDGASDGGGAEGGGDASITAGGSARQLVPGHVTLVGSGQDSCTNQRGATDDRWCAFTKPSMTLGLDELWVINVTKAAAGTAIKCDTLDPNCLRLTTGLFSEPNTDGIPSFRIHGFDGDTLIYYAELGPTAQTSFVGAVWAWRPGWAKGHKLTGDTGVVCNGHPEKAVALCFEGADTTTTPGALFFELHAGPLAATDTAPLPLVEKVLTGVDTDDPNLRMFQVDTSADGNWLAWSARLTPTGRETLKVQKIGDDASRLTVATDVSRWTISPDVAKWYWLKGFNYDVDGAESGTLEMAAFPAGGGVSTLAAEVGDYSVAGVKGLLMRSGEAQFVGDLKHMADRDAPTALTTLDKGVLGVIAQSGDGATAVYVKDVSTDRLTDLWVRNAAAPVPCALSTAVRAIPAADMLAQNSLTVWATFDDTSSVILGQSTSIAACRTSSFATNIAGWQPAGDTTLVYEDEFAPDGSDRATLRLAAVTNGTLPAQGAVIAANASGVYAPLAPALPAVVYSVLTGTQFDGLFIYVSPP